MKNNMEKTLEAAVSFPLPRVVMPRKLSVPVTLLPLDLRARPALPEICAVYPKGGSEGNCNVPKQYREGRIILRNLMREQTKKPGEKNWQKWEKNFEIPVCGLMREQIKKPEKKIAKNGKRILKFLCVAWLENKSKKKEKKLPKMEKELWNSGV